MVDLSTLLCECSLEGTWFFWVMVITYLESSHSYSNVYGDSKYGNYGNRGILLVIRNPGIMGIFNPIHGYMSTLINGTTAYYGYTLLNQCTMINGTILQWHLDYVPRINQWIS